jgi:hypothetical protein
MEVVLYSGWYSPALCQRHPEKAFVFGDNLRRFGKGGQAIIRDEENAVGVATKRKPAMTEASFFAEGNEDDLDAVLDDIGRVWSMLKAGKVVVIPVTGDGLVSLGRERAELPERAPSIYAAIETHIKEMCNTYPTRSVVTADAL